MFDVLLLLACTLPCCPARQVSTLLKLMQQTSLLQAANLQLSSIWQDHSTALTTIAAAAATLGVYQLTYSAAALFVDTTAPGVTYACLGASAAAVGGLGLYLRSGFVVDPERVYHVAMRKLVHHPGLEEVMGTPLAGEEAPGSLPWAVGLGFGWILSFWVWGLRFRASAGAVQQCLHVWYAAGCMHCEIDCMSGGDRHGLHITMQ